MSKQQVIKSLLLLALLVLVLILLYAFGITHYLSIEYLQEHRQTLLLLRTNHYWLFSLLFILSYVLLVSVSFPGASVLSILAGFIFGLSIGTLYTVTGATLGSTIIFLSIRYAVQSLSFHSSYKIIYKMQTGFRVNEVWYLFFLRLLPVFPFWAVNIAAAVFNVRFFTFIIVTFLGIIPGTIVYVWLGCGLAQLLDKHEPLNMALIHEPAILIPLVLLACLSLLPIYFKTNKEKN